MNDTDSNPFFEKLNHFTRCPVCKYSLDGLRDKEPCPECGVVVIRDLMTCPEMQDAAAAMTFFCIFGSLGWALFAFAYWAYSMVWISVINGYYPGSIGIYDISAVWFRSAFVIGPLALGISWFRNTKCNLYQRTMKTEHCVPKLPKRVVLVMLPGMLLGLLGFVVVFLLLSAAIG